MRVPFPTVRWDDLEATFQPEPLPAGYGFPFAIVVFARHGDGFVMADIPERGWITPSGRLEPGETPLQTAIRETWEEVGGELKQAVEIGYYTLMRTNGEILFAPAYVGWVREFGRLPANTESRGTRLATLAELPSIYWRWDELLEAMFKYAYAVSTSVSQDAAPPGRMQKL